MIELESKLENRMYKFAEAREVLSAVGFSIGGGWEYSGGSFDRPLDGEAHKVWLRMPFDVTTGNLDADQEDNDAVIRFGKPYVLKHLYQEGLDDDAQLRTIGGLLDQFSDPVDPDAPVEDEWRTRGIAALRETEDAMLH